MKPFDPFTFIQDIAADLSQQTAVFPTSFDTTLRLREVLSSNNASTANIAAIVAKDPLVAARVIQTANSAAFNRSGRTISTILAAITLIGANAVRVLALSVAMQQLRTYKQMAPYDGFCSAVMNHSRQIASVAFVLARAHTKIPADTALFAGLVHDIGYFYLIYRIAQRKELAHDDAEIDGLLRDWHGSIGHAVLSALGAPEEILAAVADHDEPRAVLVIRSLNDLIFVAHIVAARHNFGNVPTRWLREDHDETTVADLDAFLSTVDSNEEEIAQILSSL